MEQKCTDYMNRLPERMSFNKGVKEGDYDKQDHWGKHFGTYQHPG
jgi:hypothetical protein